jgi:hypothetical protein
MTKNQATPLAQPYWRKIGRVTFMASSFGDPNARETGQQLLLRMLERKAAEHGAVENKGA